MLDEKCGNGTAIGASANVIVVGMAEKMGHPILFRKFMLYGLPFMIQTIIISTMFKHRDKSLICLGLKAAEKIINFYRKRDNAGKP
jgi:hypothetical protein